MNDLKRKSDRAELDSGENGDMHRTEGRKAWLMSEVEKLERSFKVACFRRAKIMQFHADTLERGMHHVQPRAPRFLVMGYQNACKDWDLNRKRVVAYTTRAAEVYQEPIEEPTVKAEYLDHARKAPSPKRTTPSNQDQKHVEAKPDISETMPAATVDLTQADYNAEPEPIAQAQVHPPNTTENLTALEGAQGANLGPSLLPSVEILPNLSNNAIGLEANLPPDSLDTTDVPKLDVREMALFDFINSVANSPMAEESGGNMGMEGMGEGMMGMFGAAPGNASGSGGLDFGLLEAGLRGDQRDAGLKADIPNQDNPTGPSRSPATNIGPTGYEHNSFPMGMGDGSMQDPSSGMMDDAGGNLDLFSQYPAIFSASGNFSDLGFSGSGLPSTNPDGIDGGPGGEFDSSTFDYSSVNMDAFFADGMPGMDGMQ